METLTQLCESQELWAVLQFFTCVPVFSCTSTVVHPIDFSLIIFMYILYKMFCEFLTEKSER